MMRSVRNSGKLAAIALVSLSLGAASARADTILWISGSANDIGAVDVNTQSVVAGSVHNTGQNLTDIAFNANGNFFGTTFTNLFAINQNTGAATNLGAYGNETGMNALVGTTTPNTLIGASFLNNNIYLINTTNAANPTVLKTVGAPSAGDFAFIGSTLYESAFSAGPPSSPNELINVNTGTVVGLFHIGTATGPTVNNLFGLAYDGTTMYAVAGSEIYSVDPTTAILTPLFDYTQHENGEHLSGNAGGMAYIGEAGPIPTPTPTPEPASLGLLGAALAGLAFFRRSKRA